MPQRIIEKLNQSAAEILTAPQTSVVAAGGTLSASAADKLGYINSYGSTVGIYIGVVLSIVLLVVQVVKQRHYLRDRRVRLDNEALDRELSVISRAASDEFARKNLEKLELEIKALKMVQADG